MAGQGHNPSNQAAASSCTFCAGHGNEACQIVAMLMNDLFMDPTLCSPSSRSFATHQIRRKHGYCTCLHQGPHGGLGILLTSHLTVLSQTCFAHVCDDLKSAMACIAGGWVYVHPFNRALLMDDIVFICSCSLIPVGPFFANV